MIVETLRLGNFMSHRDTQIDFTPLHVACLAGDNGAGKSALLDGLTWCIWGESRVATSRDADLVYYGADAVEAEVVFRLTKAGAQRRYRVLRRRDQSGSRPKTVLDFQTDQAGAWVSLCGNGVRETQAAIDAEVGLTFHTFVRSAYLAQGQADAFTVATAGDRKAILSNILDIGAWGDYRDRARLARDEAETRLRQIGADCVRLEADLSTRPQALADLASTEAHIQQLTTAVAAVNTRLSDLARLEAEARGLRQRRTSLTQTQNEVEERRRRREGELSFQEQRRATYQNLLDRSAAIAASHAELVTTRQAERAAADQAAAVAVLQREAADLRRIIEREQGTLQRQLSGLEGELRMLSRNRAESEAASSSLAQVNAERSALDAVVDEVERLTQRRSELLLALQRLEDTLTRIGDRVLANQEQAQAMPDQADCPRCGQPITEAHRLSLLEELETEHDDLLSQRAQAETSKADSRQRLISIDAELARLRASQKRLTQLDQQSARLQQQVDSGAATLCRLAEVGAEAARLRDRITNREFALEEQARLTHVESQLGAVGYDAEGHHRLRVELVQLEAGEAEYIALQEARVGVVAVDEATLRLTREIQEDNVQADAVIQEIAHIVAQLQPIDQDLLTLSIEQQNLAKLSTEHAAAERRLGALTQRLHSLGQAEQTLTNLTTERTGLETRAGMLRTLYAAFGLNGVPAMVIEHALPELEREANSLLEKLTGGRMHVRFETQRLTQIGTTQETLDIIISDEKSERPYESFSGGEKFRINFAIRVALSYLLARRAGVQLRSLFIDEGFGALDDDGRRRLVSAVQAIESDFDLILVITHVADLRDAFPDQVLVTKTDQGSQVLVSG